VRLIRTPILHSSRARGTLWRRIRTSLQASRDAAGTSASPIKEEHMQNATAMKGPGAATALNWKAIDSEPRFQDLHRRKMGFLWGLMVFSLVYYFLLPIGAAYFQDLFKVKVWGPVNVGLLFALSEFIVAWGIAFYYAKRASSEFDPMAAAIVKDAEAKLGGRS
jgi:uncharacterized membrane protein (DUF485 family)